MERLYRAPHLLDSRLGAQGGLAGLDVGADEDEAGGGEEVGGVLLLLLLPLATAAVTRLAVRVHEENTALIKNKNIYY
jgi:hypothetical protein